MENNFVYVCFDSEQIINIAESLASYIIFKYYIEPKLRIPKNCVFAEPYLIKIFVSKEQYSHIVKNKSENKGYNIIFNPRINNNEELKIAIEEQL